MFSDTTNRTGLIQSCERWTNLGAAGISGTPELLKDFTARINEAYDEVLPVIFSADATWQWDDSNHVKGPSATTDLVSGQSVYSVVTDQNGNSVLEIQAAFIKDENGEWQELDAINSAAALTQNSTNTGTPTQYDKNGISLVLNKIPNYSTTGGLKLVFSRTPSYFVSTDTTKTAGIPAHFARLLSLIASYDWLLVNKAENVTLITRLEGKITEAKTQLGAHMSKRSRDERTVARARTESSR